MSESRLEIHPKFADALGITGLDRSGIAQRLAQIGELRAPTRPETEELLLEVLLKALRQIPGPPSVSSWGEFHNGGIQPFYEMDSERDAPRVAACAVDLGLGDEPVRGSDDEILSPLEALGRRLMEAIEHLLLKLRRQLEAAGIRP